MQVKAQTSFRLKNVDTPTQLRIEYNVNSPKYRNMNQEFKIVDLNELEADNVDPPMPDFITQVQQPSEDELPVVMERSSCFCASICLFGVCRCNREKRTEVAKETPKTSETNNRVQIKKENRASIIRTNTLEKKSTVQPAAVQLSTIPPVSYGGCYMQQDEESTEEDEAASPWPEGEGEIVVVTDDSISSSGEYQGLLGPKEKQFKGKKCLVLDLDETLVHSSFKPVADADYIVPVEIQGVTYRVYVLKRPFVDEFLAECAKHYELVVFTASLGKYANPLLDMLDKENLITHRLFRESCVFHKNAYVKDLSKLGRRLEDIIFIDNSALSYAFQPNNAIPITSWFNDRSDRELQALLPVLQTTLKDIKDVRTLLDANKSYEWICAQGAQTHITTI